MKSSNKIKKTASVFMLGLMLFVFLRAEAQVYLESETKKLTGNQLVSTQNEVYIELSSGQMYVKYIKPEEFFIETNLHGEMTVYFPKTNEVLKQRNAFFSSESELIYHFFTQQDVDLGLSTSGFDLDKTYYDQQYVVTEWKADLLTQKQFKKAKLVQEDYLPIYLEFYRDKEEPVQKIYFDDWDSSDAAVFPKRITQIDFIPTGDSIVSRKVYSNILTGANAKQQFRKPEIPADAKLVTGKN